MSDHRWQGHTHGELFQQINEGPGAAASHAPVRRWTELTRALGEIDAGIASALSGALGHWEGDAADSARNGLRPLGDWAVEAQAAAEEMRVRAEQQAEFISKARADMPPPMAVASEDPGTAVSLLTHLFGGQTDYEIDEAKQNAAEQRAFAVMRTYDLSTQGNTTSLATFTPPPQVVVDAPPPSSRGGAGTSHLPITITWGGSPVGGGTGTGGGAGTSGGRGAGTATSRGGSSRSGHAPQTRGSGESRAPGGGVGGRAANRRSRDDAEPVDQTVTEQHGQDGGLFDEQRTLSRPVIGGEPG